MRLRNIELIAYVVAKLNTVLQQLQTSKQNTEDRGNRFEMLPPVFYFENKKKPGRSILKKKKAKR